MSQVNDGIYMKNTYSILKKFVHFPKRSLTYVKPTKAKTDYSIKPLSASRTSWMQPWKPLHYRIKQFIVHVGHRVYDDNFQPIVKTFFCFPLEAAPDVKVQEWSHIDGNLIDKIFIHSWPRIGS